MTGLTADEGASDIEPGKGAAVEDGDPNGDAGKGKVPPTDEQLIHFLREQNMYSPALYDNLVAMSLSVSDFVDIAPTDLAELCDRLHITVAEKIKFKKAVKSMNVAPTNSTNTTNNSNRNSNSTGAITKIKMVVIGASGVGKSALLMRWLFNDFLVVTEYTIEDCYTKPLALPNAMPVLFDIVDTCGQEEMIAMRLAHYRDAQVMLLVYSITSMKTFDGIESRIARVERERGGAENGVPLMVLIGNKCDLENMRQVPKSDGQLLASKHSNMIFIEASAKTKYNLDILVNSMLLEIERRQIGFVAAEQSKTINHQNNAADCKRCVCL